MMNYYRPIAFSSIYEVVDKIVEDMCFIIWERTYD